MDFEKHSFSFFLRGKRNPFVYEISTEEKERFDDLSRSGMVDNPYASFFCFETRSGLAVCISLKHLQFAYNLFDPDYEKIYTTIFSQNNGGGAISMSLLRKKVDFGDLYPDHENVHVYLAGRKEILKCGVTEPGEAFNIFVFLDGYRDSTGAFLTFTDIDGETVLINPEDILVLELPRDLYQKGYEEMRPQS